ncbi:MAG: hypothetical protein WD045_10990 [Pirellulaceae bacterium]
MTHPHSAPLLTCDEVFDTLTRAPFPTGNRQSDDAIRRHLACCHDCRQLAEALRPATTALAHSLPEEEETQSTETNLPCFTASLSTPSTDQPLIPLRRSTWFGLAAAICLLVVVRLGTFDPATPTLSGPRSGSTIDYSQVSTSGIPAWASLCSLNAPEMRAADRSSSENLPLRLISDGGKQVDRTPPPTAASQCCSRCHHGGEDAAAPHGPVDRQWQQNHLLAIVQSCGGCHSQP